MLNHIAKAAIVMGFLVGACSPSASASGSAASSAELVGNYECFGLESGSAEAISTLSLNSDGTGTFGAAAIQWSYSPGTNMVTFTGDANLKSATYLSDGPSLSIDMAGGAGIAGAVDGHFTCVRA
jgi:hypothetical protein